MFTIPTNVVSVHPAIEPVGVEEVKLNAYVVDTHEDNQFITTQLIPAARQAIERLTGRSLITQTRIQYHDDLPYPPIVLRYGPVQSVSSITYTDANETTQTLSSTLYDVDTKRMAARIDVGYGDSWPSALNKVNSVAITYVAGYGSTPSAVPIMYRRAIIVLCTHWYENRDQIGCVEGDLYQTVCSLIALEGRTLEYA